MDLFVVGIALLAGGVYLGPPDVGQGRPREGRRGEGEGRGAEGEARRGARPHRADVGRGCGSRLEGVGASTEAATEAVEAAGASTKGRRARSSRSRESWRRCRRTSLRGAPDRRRHRPDGRRDRPVRKGLALLRAEPTGEGAGMADERTEGSSATSSGSRRKAGSRRWRRADPARGACRRPVVDRRGRRARPRDGRPARAGRAPLAGGSFIAEAIILPNERPVVDMVNGTYATPPAPFRQLGKKAARTRIQAALPAIGRVELPDHPSLPYGGTGFVVGHGLLMTNRHVAELFAKGLGREALSFIPGQSAAVDFLRERDRPDSLLFQVRGWRWCIPIGTWPCWRSTAWRRDAAEPLDRAARRPPRARRRRWWDIRRSTRATRWTSRTGSSTGSST